MKQFSLFAALMLLTGCASTPKPTVPSLNPEQAAELLHFDHKADAWITYVKKQNPACSYKLTLPDQSTHPTEIDMNHIVSCGSAPSPKEFDATVVFTYDQAAQKWVVSRFSS